MYQLTRPLAAILATARVALDCPLVGRSLSQRKRVEGSIPAFGPFQPETAQSPRVGNEALTGGTANATRGQTQGVEESEDPWDVSQAGEDPVQLPVGHALAIHPEPPRQLPLREPKVLGLSG